ncbi:flagellar filament capping protein FliD [Novosphingobium profundi]|uniref:flagellar filament capping protein FliD n=1 Tax=Novosphingobium profundi TaxID=1774954 RepID=UPI001BDA1C8E|nr:flagellar filament capping protein FliD [Novosphingobium profundi]MBT0670438.1 flagellar filament capping protein FliD [Novosphingobium profundi]
MTTISTSPTATSSLVTALGGGSGIDMLDLANKLAQAQFANKVNQLETRSETLTTQISTASDIKSMLLALDTSLGTLIRTGDLSRTPSVANTAVASATLTGSSLPQGSYDLEVTSLAKGQNLASRAYGSATDTVGAGTLTLRFGTVSGSTFSEDTAHAAVDITIASGATLADVAKAINGANAGVQAYVAQTVSGAQLVLKGQAGAANGFVLEASEDPLEPGLAGLAWNPSSTSGQLLNGASNAAFKVDGLSYTATSNAVSDVIPGVKLQLTGTNVGAATKVTFADPTSAIASSMQDLTDALNEVMSALNTATGIGGDLANDAGARALKRSLSGLAGTVIMPNATGAARTLADLGLKTERDGTFTLDTTRLNATIAADPEGVSAMFTTGVYGVYASVDKIYRTASSSTGLNSLGASIKKYTALLSAVTDSQTDVAEQQEKLRARLASQFTTSESRIGLLNATKSMLESQIAQWNKTSS